MMRKSKLFKKKLTLAISTVSALMMAAPGNVAYAQADELEEITVTGSRIVRRDLSAPSPIVTVGNESFENSSTIGAESVLNQLPQFVPDGSQFTSGIQSGPTSSPGAATLNLRGLGSNRNLVLIDGRRGQPANSSLAVDINTIPSSAIANVEVITGGASSVYGPDAMAGVVNFKLKNDFEGFEIDAQFGTTAEGDGDENKISMLMGMNSSDGRGNIMIGVDWTDRSPIFQKDRDFFVDAWNDPNTYGGGFPSARGYGAGESGIEGGQNAPSQAAVDALFDPSLGQVSPTENFYFNNDGTPFIVSGARGYNGPLNCWEGCGSFTGTKITADGNLDQTFTEGYLSTPLERYSIFMSGHYDLTDNVSAFMTSNYTNQQVTTRGGIPPAITVWQAPIPRDGRALPAALNSLLDSRTGTEGATGDWSLYQPIWYQGRPIEPVHTRNTWQIVMGLNGSFHDGDSTWEAYVSRGDTNSESINYGLPSLQRYQALVSAPDFGVGGVSAARGYGIACDSGLPVFSDFTPDASCIAGIETLMLDSSKLTQDIAEANLQGRVMDLWAGEMRYAAGATYRENSYQYNPGNPAGALVDNPIGLFASNSTGGKIDVTEFYGELLVPVLDTVDLELGYRRSDFSTAGAHDTYKAQFTWGAMDGVLIRGGYQAATRAPNIAELFTAPTQVVVFIPGQEPCSSTTLKEWGNLPSNPDRAQVQSLCRDLIGNSTSDFDTQTYNAGGITGPDGWHRRSPSYFPLAIESREGNPDVAPEKGTTFTLGAVLSEPFGVENLSVTVDAYRIEIEDSISPLSATTIYDNCFNRYGTNPSYDIGNEFCQLITRNASTGDRQEVAALYFNLGILETQGLDLSVNWGMEVGEGNFTVNTNLNYLDSFEYQTAPGQAIANAKGTMDRGGLYDFQAFTNFRYDFHNGLGFGLNWIYRSDIEDAAYSLDSNTPNLGTGDYSVFNFTANYAWNNLGFRFGIDNLLDTQPNNIGAVNPGVDANAGATNAGIYDVIGRRYYLGVKASF